MSLCILFARPKSICYQCILTELERFLFIFVPSFQCNFSCSSESGRGLSGSSFGGPNVHNTGMVPKASALGDRLSSDSPEVRKSVSPAKHTGTSSVKENGAVCFQNLREELENRGFSSEITSVIIASWRPSTRKHYGAYLSKWLLFCSEAKVSPFQPSVKNIVQFLMGLHSSGLGYSAINTAKSAVCSVVYLLYNIHYGNHILNKQFMKGIFNIKPVLPKNHCTWNVDVVLKYVSSLFPHEDISLL